MAKSCGFTKSFTFTKILSQYCWKWHTPHFSIMYFTCFQLELCEFCECFSQSPYNQMVNHSQTAFTFLFFIHFVNVLWMFCECPPHISSLPYLPITRLCWSISVPYFPISVPYFSITCPYLLWRRILCGNGEGEVKKWINCLVKMKNMLYICGRITECLMNLKRTDRN